MSIAPSFLGKVKRSILRRTFGASNKDQRNLELLRLHNLPRYVHTVTNLPGFEIEIPDGPSFAAVWTEVFEREIYNFNANTSSPRILDCGANVGLSCLYFKSRFPNSRITAFEPDPAIFNCLERMMNFGKLHDVELIPKAVWSSETTLQFTSEGSDAGRIDCENSSKSINIQTIRLNEYLREPIDFLKIDIEGAETEVICDCAENLHNVNNLFVEYHSFLGKPQTLHNLLATLNNAGFRLQIQDVGIAAKPFLEVKSYLGMDMQLNIFGYRAGVNH